MDRPPEENKYEPLPRWGHASVAIGDKVFMWGGRTEDFSDTSKQELASLVEVFDVVSEQWERKTTGGSPPPGLYNNAHTSLGHYLYTYGGWDGQVAYNTLHQLDTTTMTWGELVPSNPSDAPMKMSGCGIVAYGDHKLVLFGGYGVPPEKALPGSVFYQRNTGSEEKGWTNELKVFNIEEGSWSTPTTTGECPPPCVDFSFTRVDEHRAVVFGGYQPEAGTVADTYILNMETWHWTKLSEGDDPGVSSPVGRDGHTACLLTTQPHPQLLITGGWDKSNKAIHDAWIFDVNAGTWKELPLPLDVGHRFWHSVVAVNYSLRLRQLVFFGGCPGTPEDMCGGSWTKLAATVMVELGRINVLNPISSSENSEDWIVLDAMDNTQLGNPARRMRERTLLAEYRATRAEQIAREALKKLETISQRPTPIPEVDTEVFAMITKEEEKKPFWVIPREEIQLSGKELGRGRWAIVRVAIYRGIQVAAKCLFSQILSEDNRKVFIECLDMAAKLRHPNLLPFIGAVLEGEPIIITELMPFNLKTVLEKNELPYHHIVSIAVDVAKALNFLHTMKPEPLVHGDLTSTSVLLEQARGAKWKAKLSDFMTARYFQHLVASAPNDDELMSPTHVPSSISPPIMTGPEGSISPPGMGKKRISMTGLDKANFGSMGSIGSIGSIGSLGIIGRKISVSATEDTDPTHFTPKRDIHSYGALLIELCTRTSPLEVSVNYLIESIRWPSIVALIKSCMEQDPDKRPTMEEIIPQVVALEAAVAVPPHAIHK